VALLDPLRRYLDGEDPKPAAAIFALNFGDLVDSKAYQWLAPTIAASFGKGVGDFGLISIFLVIVAPILALPISRLADRGARMPLALACAGAWGFCSLSTGLSTTLTLFIIVRIGASLGETVSYPVHYSLLSDFYPPTLRAKVFGIHSMAAAAGGALGPMIAGLTSHFFGWHAAFFVVSSFTWLALIYAWKVKEPARGAYERVEHVEGVSMPEALRRLWSIRSVRFQWLAYLWFAGGLFGAILTIPFFFKDQYGVGDFGMGVIAAVGSGGAFFATYVGAALGQRQLAQAPHTGVRWLAGVTAAVVGLLALFALTPTLYVSVALFVISSMLFGLVSPLHIAVLTLTAPPELRARAYAIGQIIALAGTPFAILIPQFAQHVNYRVAFLFAGLVFLRGTFHVLTVSRYADADVERLDPAHVDEAARVDESGRKVLLETKGLTVSYGGVQVLFGVDLVVREGECVALLGTNGAGKSTVLNAVSGLVEPDGGNVWFDGVAITGETPERVAAKGLIQAPGGRGIFPGLTVEENLRLGGFLLRGDKKATAERVAAALEVFPKLTSLLTQRAGSLSGGERQMLVLAQAFLLKPRMLLIDELSLGLAPVVVQDLLEAVRRLKDEGVTIVVVEQSVNVALTLADRAYFMEKGEVRFEGPAAELLERNDLLRSVFFGGAGEHVGTLS